MTINIKDLMNSHIKDYLPKDSLDDIHSIDLDIDNLFLKYLNPIDRYRSHVSPLILSKNLSQELEPSKVPLESRCHAFYRMLGLPVIAPDGQFFNIGFPLYSENKDRQQDIISKINDSSVTDMKQAIAKRESDSQYRYNLFSVGNVEASILALSLATPNGQRKFSIKSGTLTESLSKPQVIPYRTQYINKFYSNNGNTIINKFESVSHQLAPFITDPIIAANVEPKSGSNNVLIGLPFLDKSKLEYESGKYVKRPGIEFILRIKLKEQSLLDRLQKAGLVKNIVPSLISDATGMISFGLSTEDAERLYDTGIVDFHTVNDLLKTYKGLVSLYHNAMSTIEDVSNKILWVPKPSEGGPESGTIVSTTYVQPRKYLDSWEVERRITQLEVKAFLAKQQIDLGQNNDYSNLSYNDFTISEFQNVSETFDEELKQEKSKRANLEAQGSNALRIIEIIGGEVSGLGLIDIIAIYLSLWSLDVPTLLNLIDDAAAIRLNNITELKTADTIERASREGNAKDAYEKLSKKIEEILKFGDYILNHLRGSPKDGSSGDVVRNKG